MPIGHYTSRVGNRAALAQLLKDKYLADATNTGLSAADLDVIITQGTIARDADREQHEQLAANSAARADHAASARGVFEREEELRARLPAIPGDLGAANQALADWLSHLTFARYRFRDVAAPPARPAAPASPAAPGAPTAADVEEAKKVERVLRADMPTRLDGLAAFCAALLKPGREPIVAALAARGFDQAKLAALGADAEAAAKHGLNKLPAAEATARESDAVVAQRAKWSAVVRMIKAVARKHPDVASKLADC